MHTTTVRVDQKVGNDWHSYRVPVTPGAVYGGWRITGTPIYAGFDYFALTFICTPNGVSVGDLVRSEYGTMYLRPHHSPDSSAYYSKWLYPIEPV